LQQITGIQERPSPRQSSIWAFAKNSYIINSFKHISREVSEKKFRFDAIASEFTKNQIFLLTPLKKCKSSNGSVSSLSDGAGTPSGGAPTASFLLPRRITEVTLKVNQACS